jgi:amidophosphoribosyltransferase
VGRRAFVGAVGYHRLVDPPTDRQLRDACGVVGIHAPGEDVARLTYHALYALQHRGQESAGIAISDGSSMVVYKDLGLVAQVFDETVLESLRGHLAVGHVRYSTMGASSWSNAQPTYKSTGSGEIAVAHNGNLVNSVDLKVSLDEIGGDPTPESARPRSSSDTDLVAAHIARASKGDMQAAILEVLPRLSGAFSFTMMDGERVYGARDPQGFRPLCIGRLAGGGWILVSETCALDLVGARFIRDVEPGELVAIDESGLSSQTFEVPRHAACVFEHVYFSRPDSMLMGQNVYATRYRMGQDLAGESPAEAELVLPVPDSGVPAAQGYAQASGISYGEGFVKNRYVGRTFIKPTQSMRQQGIRMKLNPLKEVIEGKRVVVIDDSIVRGNTTRQIVAMLQDAGVREVHMRISSPPIKWPCFYGIDMPDQNELIGANLDVEEIRSHIGADSLAYLSLEGMLKATEVPADEFCTACFSSRYPVPIPVHELRGKHVLEPSEDRLGESRWQMRRR